MSGTPRQSASGFERSLWSATGGAAASFAPLRETIEAKVTVIGGGFAGASLALALAERGGTVALLEARRIGWGASGRNGGFIVPTLSRLDPDGMVVAMGAAGERLADIVGGSADTVFDLIRKYRIDCDGAQSGWYQPGHTARAWPILQSRFRQWSARGVDVALLDPAETELRTGCAFFHGSLFFGSGGTVHPLKLTRGLIDAAHGLGAHCFEDSAVRKIERTGERWRVKTDQGTVVSDWVVICANAMPQDTVPALGRSVAPMRIFQAATRPVPQAQRRHLFAKGEALSDTAINLFTYRFDRDWRLITGQLPFYPGQSPAALADLMARRLQRMLDLHAKPEIEFIWDGLAAVTPDFAPKLFSLGPHMVATTSCNGRGIAMSVALGRHLGAAIADGDLSRLPLRLSTPGREGRRLALRAGLSAFPLLGLARDGRPFIPPARPPAPQEASPS